VQAVTRGRSRKRQGTKKGFVAKPAPASDSIRHPARLTGGSRTSSSQARLVCAGGVFVAALFLYSRTLAPTVTLVDSGELIVAARYAGVPHPPGFPLWVMLAHMASLMPFGSVAARINFASAVFAALACGVFTLAVAELMIIASYLSRRNPRPGKKPAPKSEKASPGGSAGWLGSTSMRLLVLGPAVASGLLMAFSRTLWSYATIAEVYTLNTLLIVLVIFFMLRWRRRVIEETSHPNTIVPSNAREGAITHYDSWLYAAAFVFGLGLGVHHVTVALILPSLALFVYRTQGLCFFTSKKLLLAAVFSMIALVATYTYLPLAASRAPVLNWGNPSSLTQIWWHITGRQYQVFFSFTPQVIGEQLAEFGRMSLREFGPPWMPFALALALAGFGYAFKRDRTTFWLLGLLIGGDLAYGLCYQIAEDKDAYYLPTFISLAMAAGFGLRWLLEFPWVKLKLARALPVLLLPAVALVGNWPFNDRSRYFIAHDYVENILGTIAPGGLLLTLDWQVASPMLYSREIEQRRRDVKVVDVHLLRRSWYFDYLRRAYSQLIARSQREVEAYLAELKQWERDPGAYANDARRTERINSAYREMWQALVTNEARIAPVYLTSDMAFMKGGDDKEFSEWLVRSYQFVVRGLVFQLSQNRGLEDLGDLHLETRGLADGTLRFEKDDVVKLKVLPVYTNMLVNRGRYLTLLKQHERAAAAFARALVLDPSLQVARDGFNESRGMLQKR
jgi:tetratricopeptide (TPR) repeat protein